MSERVLLVGESNPYSRNPAHALYPYPERASGGRLAAFLDLTPRAYLRTFDRVDLLPDGRWSAGAARAAAQALTHRRRIRLGAKVAAAHGADFSPLAWIDAGPWLILPHPSARCRLWTAYMVEAARRAVRQLLEIGS